jgi:hypothetical protein
MLSITQFRQIQQRFKSRAAHRSLQLGAAAARNQVHVMFCIFVFSLHNLKFNWVVVLSWEGDHTALADYGILMTICML